GQFGLQRRGYHLPTDRIADSGRAALLLFPRRAAEPYVRPMTAKQAHQRISAADLIINDLRRYWAFAAIMEQLSPAGLVARREEHLVRLTNGVACYELGIAPEATRSAVAEIILQLMQDTPPRIAGARR